MIFFQQLFLKGKSSLSHIRGFRFFREFKGDKINMLQLDGKWDKFMLIHVYDKNGKILKTFKNQTEVLKFYKIEGRKIKDAIKTENL